MKVYRTDRWVGPRRGDACLLMGKDARRKGSLGPRPGTRL